MSQTIRTMKRSVNSSTITPLLDNYNLHPVETLRTVHEMFGRNNFERVFAFYLQRNCNKVAFVLSVKFFTKKRSH